VTKRRPLFSVYFSFHLSFTPNSLTACFPPFPFLRFTFQALIRCFLVKITCLLLEHYMFTSRALHVYFSSITCLLLEHYMLTSRALHVYFSSITCLLLEHCMFTSRALHEKWYACSHTAIANHSTLLHPLSFVNRSSVDAVHSGRLVCQLFSFYVAK